MSQSKNSEDTELCGIISKPCRTVNYALSSVKQDGHIIAIDNRFKYKITATKITHSVSMQAWLLRKSNRQTVKFYTRHEIGPIFTCIGNITITMIYFQAPHRVNLLWFKLMKLCKRAIFNGCRFGAVKAFKARVVYFPYLPKSISNLDGTSLDLVINRSQVGFFLYNTPKIRSSLNMEQTSTMKIKVNATNILITDSSSASSTDSLKLFHSHIAIENSTFRGKLHIFKGKIIIHNCKFNRSSVLVNGLNAVFSNVVFNGTVVQIQVESCYVHNTSFISTINASFPNAYLSRTAPILIKADCIKFIKCLFNCRLRSSYNEIVSFLLISRRFKSVNNVSMIDTEFHSTHRDKPVLKLMSYTMYNFHNTYIHCSKFDEIVRQKAPKKDPNSVLVVCQKCDKNEYSFNNSELLSNTFNKSLRYEDEKADKCHVCPYKASCTKHHVKVIGGYWGYLEKRTTMLSLVSCPSYYCCTSKETCKSFNTCFKNRMGRLCSDCQPGYSVEMNTYQCEQNKNCDTIKITLIIFSLIAVLFNLTLVYLKEIIFFLKRRFVLNNNKHRNFENNTLTDDRNDFQERLLHASIVENSSDRTPYQILRNAKDIPDTSYRKKVSSMMSGSLKIIFFYYQAATLIRIQSTDKIELIFPKFLDGLFTIFNIKLDFQNSNIGFCIMPNMTHIQAKLSKLGLVTMNFIIVLLFGIGSYLFDLIKNARRETLEKLQKYQFQYINEDIPSYSNPPFIVRVKCLYVQLLLLTFSTIATYSFDAVHCVRINDELYLYTQASIKCYQLWQYMVLLFIVLWIIPFISTLYIGPKLLYRCYITPTQFLLGLTFPPFLLLIFLKHKVSVNDKCKLTMSDGILAKHLLLIVNEPFRTSFENNDKLCWESMLILRRMLLVILNIFIMSSIIKLFPMGFLLLIYLIQNSKLKPFENVLLNDIDNIGLLALVSLVMLNMFWAVTTEYNLMRSSAYKTFGEVLMYYEFLILSLPVLSLMFYLIFKLFYVLFKLFHFIYRYIRYG